MEEERPPRKIPLIFYRARPGREPVREWLKGLPEAERHAIGKDLMRAQWRWPVGMPLCRPMGGGLWEIRRICRHAGRRACCSPSRGAPSGAARIYQENARRVGRCGSSLGCRGSCRGRGVPPGTCKYLGEALCSRTPNTLAVRTSWFTSANIYATVPIMCQAYYQLV